MSFCEIVILRLSSLGVGGGAALTPPLGVFEPIAVAVALDDVTAVRKAIESGSGEPPLPMVERRLVTKNVEEPAIARK